MCLFICTISLPYCQPYYRRTGIHIQTLDVHSSLLSASIFAPTLSLLLVGVLGGAAGRGYPSVGHVASTLNLEPHVLHGGAAVASTSSTRCSIPHDEPGTEHPTSLGNVVIAWEGAVVAAAEECRAAIHAANKTRIRARGGAIGIVGAEGATADSPAHTELVLDLRDLLERFLLLGVQVGDGGAAPKLGVDEAAWQTRARLRHVIHHGEARAVLAAAEEHLEVRRAACRWLEAVVVHADASAANHPIGLESGNRHFDVSKGAPTPC